MAVKKAMILAAGGAALAAKPFEGGKCMLIAEATWSAGNIKLQTQGPNGTFIDVPNSTLSANGMLVLDLPCNPVKLVITTSTAVYANLLPITQ